MPSGTQAIKFNHDEIGKGEEQHVFLVTKEV